ncbi:hypothetical protein P7C71_g6184, partial [Lecanoromycetidae sp. Uapishka_2]
MTEVPLAVPSAVILPEPEQLPSTPPGSLKRRQSSVSEDRPKRPRFNEEDGNENGQASAASPPNRRPVERISERRRSGQVEERKRGQRLFGALLGTLSQSSSSTASNRRSEIEKKQQAKLKLQAEEETEKKRLKKEALTAYYKPWELLPSQEARITSQVAEAEATIERENKQWDAEYANPEQKEISDEEKKPPEPSEAAETNGHEDTVGSPADREKPSSPKADEDTNMNDTTPPDVPGKTTEPPEGSKDHGDDGGEVVEGDEDTVIY